MRGHMQGMKRKPQAAGLSALLHSWVCGPNQVRDLDPLVLSVWQRPQGFGAGSQPLASVDSSHKTDLMTCKQVARGPSSTTGPGCSSPSGGGVHTTKASAVTQGERPLPVPGHIQPCEALCEEAHDTVQGLVPPV